MKLNLGSNRNILHGYINIDQYVDHPEVHKYDILSLPFQSGSVEEILAEHLFEHVGFGDEQALWTECYRVLKPGGRLIVETPDMEWLCKAFLEAQDDFKTFYQVGTIDHFFGSGRDVSQRWSVLIANIFGNQNGKGQFHKNAYTLPKFTAISKLIGFSECSVETCFNKGAQAIRATFIK